jgi:hypothetical protein
MGRKKAKISEAMIDLILGLCIAICLIPLALRLRERSTAMTLLMWLLILSIAHINFRRLTHLIKLDCFELKENTKGRKNARTKAAALAAVVYFASIASTLLLTAAIASMRGKTGCLSFIILLMYQISPRLWKVGTLLLLTPALVGLYAWINYGIDRNDSTMDNKPKSARVCFDAFAIWIMGSFVILCLP